MKICIVTPAPARSRAGNRVTALRWTRILRDLGHRVVLTQTYDGRHCDALVALHARRSFPSIERFSSDNPLSPLIVALTGTDLYRDIQVSERAQESLRRAWRLVLLQAHGLERLPEDLHVKARVIYQSATAVQGAASPLRRSFEICVAGHLRPVKDPLRAALAARKLPRESRILVTHAGAALTPAMQRRATRESKRNPRYRWLGEVPRWRARRLIARSRLLVVSSKAEGCPNVASEALAAGVPILSSEISGMIGLLGPDYPGYFPVGDTLALASLLHRAETDLAFYARIARACRRVRRLVDPRREKRAWRDLLQETAR